MMVLIGGFEHEDTYKFKNDNRGDLVRCSDCGELMLIQIGGTACGECESENLQWYDSDRPEWTIAELEESGFIIIEK